MNGGAVTTFVHLCKQLHQQLGEPSPMTGGAVADEPLQKCDPKGADCLIVIWPSTFIHPQVNLLTKGSSRPDCQASSTVSNQVMLHDGYRGVDIQLKYNFESDQFTLFCDTYTNGSADFFLMINSTIPTLALPNDQFSIPFDGIPTFVRSSCLKKVQQSGRGSLISYRPKKSSGISRVEDWHRAFYLVQSTQQIESY